MRGGLALALLVVLSGCSQPADEEPAPGIGGAVVSGVVVSEAIVPLANASLLLEPGSRTATTDSSGAFAFADVPAGAYTLQATLEGFQAAQVSLQVQDGSAPPVKLVLQADARTACFVESYAFDGFLEWSFNLGGLRGSNSLSPNYTIGQRAPDFIQSEMVWQSTQALGTSLSLSAIANDGGVSVPVIAEASGPSPLLLALRTEDIQAAKLGPDILLDYTAFAGEEPVAADMGAGVALSQPYRLVTHMFYGYTPPDGWRFTADGEPPAPT